MTIMNESLTANNGFAFSRQRQASAQNPKELIIVRFSYCWQILKCLIKVPTDDQKLTKNESKIYQAEHKKMSCGMLCRKGTPSKKL
jgi:hypothetical protein